MKQLSIATKPQICAKLWNELNISVTYILSYVSFPSQLFYQVSLPTIHQSVMVGWVGVSSLFVAEMNEFTIMTILGNSEINTFTNMDEAKHQIPT